jgi:predicted Zn-dependent protease
MGKFIHSAVVAGALLACASAWTQTADGVQVGGISKAAGLESADRVEQSAAQQYRQMMEQARAQNALAPDNHPQTRRLRAIAQRIIPYANDWNPRSKAWQWEVNLLGSKQINAFCMPGGKIAFYSGILTQLQLSDDEVAMIMGHEVAHALREHARERMGKQAATRTGLSILSNIFGLGNLGQAAADVGTQLLSLRFGREDETEADLVGLELAARAGYDPRAGITLWEKMGAASGGGGAPQWLSTHPKGDNRIKRITDTLPIVMPLYTKAAKPTEKFGPPAVSSASASPANPAKPASRPGLVTEGVR